MTAEFNEKYIKSVAIDLEYGDRPDLFYNGYRRAVNQVGTKGEYVNQKLNAILGIIKNEEKRQTLIFTNWIEAGVDVIKHAFKENGISYLIIEGSVPATTRMNIVEKFNNRQAQVLIITTAGSEGLDLKGVRDVIILDPVWNPASYEQIIGRAIRYKSHSHLPVDERFVDIYMLILQSLSSKVPSGDELLYGLIDKKREILNDVLEILKSASI